EEGFSDIHTIQSYVEKQGIHPNDIVFLGMQKSRMRAIDDFLKGRGEKTTTTFISSEELALLEEKNVENLAEEERKLERHLKINFWMNAGSVKISTVQSFKGWEANTIILFISNAADSDTA